MLSAVLLGCQDFGADCPDGWVKEVGLCVAQVGADLPDASCEERSTNGHLRKMFLIAGQFAVNTSAWSEMEKADFAERCHVPDTNLLIGKMCEARVVFISEVAWGGRSALQTVRAKPSLPP